MFALSLIEHDLSLPPELLSLPLDKAISGELERLFLDKVIPNLGLCVSVYDIQSVNGGIVYPNEGAPAYVVRFRLVMFRPFVGEILVGKIQSSDVNGLRCALPVSFFIHVVTSFFNCYQSVSGHLIIRDVLPIHDTPPQYPESSMPIKSPKYHSN
ncbi:RNA polymerase Rpb7 N-terminal domain-containing protein isoform X2 [Tasmannia lanceolata]|uniref:RNA polymerase Rpb7 N-terminal domain-containing protein isoform X2 n=1 Tax=Tasmannia lanceolata TaxID=3420 RepID=UPI0040629382